GGPQLPRPGLHAAHLPGRRRPGRPAALQLGVANRHGGGGHGVCAGGRADRPAQGGGRPGPRGRLPAGPPAARPPGPRGPARDVDALADDAEGAGGPAARRAAVGGAALDAAVRLRRLRATAVLQAGVAARLGQAEGALNDLELAVQLYGGDAGFLVEAAKGYG